MDIWCFALPFNMGKYHICHVGTLERLAKGLIYMYRRYWYQKELDYSNFVLCLARKRVWWENLTFLLWILDKHFFVNASCIYTEHFPLKLLISTCISIGKNIMETEIWSGSWEKQSRNASILQGALISMKISECIMHFEYTFCCTHSLSLELKSI